MKDRSAGKIDLIEKLSPKSTPEREDNNVAAEGAPRDREVIALVGLAHGTSHFFHLMLPTLFPWLMRDFSLSFTDVGLLTTTFFVISGIGQALAGFVVDRVGGWRVLCFGVGTLALAGVVLGLANSYTSLLLSATVSQATWDGQWRRSSWPA